jgi:hypothetical protein
MASKSKINEILSGVINSVIAIYSGGQGSRGHEQFGGHAAYFSLKGERHEMNAEAV